MLGRSATATAVGEVADLAAVRHVPDHAGLVPLVHGGRGDTAGEISAGGGQADKAGREEDRQSKGLHGDGVWLKD